MKKRKLVLALMLSLMMLVTMIPSFSFADATGGTGSSAGSGAKSAATSGTCGATGSDVKWNFDTATGTLTISGTGAMADYTKNITSSDADQPWKAYTNEIKQVCIKNGVTRIGAFAFNGLGTVESYQIAGSVATVGEWAIDSTAVNNFDVDSNSKGLTVVDGALLTKDQKELLAFPCGNESIKKYTLPQETKTISAGAFSGASHLEAIDLTNVEAIGSLAFMNAGIKKLEIPETANTVMNWAFAGCNAMEQLTISSSNLSMGDNAVFPGCTALKSLKISENGNVVFTGNPFRGSGAYKAVTSLEVADLFGKISGNGIKTFFAAQNNLKTVNADGTNAGLLTAANFPNVETINITGENASLIPWGFANNTSLKNVNIDVEGNVNVNNTNGLEGVFRRALGLETVTIKAAGVTFDKNAFVECKSLKIVDLKECKNITYAESCFNTNASSGYTSINKDFVIYVSDNNQIPKAVTGVTTGNGIVISTNGGSFSEYPANPNGEFPMAKKSGYSLIRWYIEGSWDSQTNSTVTATAPTVGNKYIAEWKAKADQEISFDMGDVTVHANEKAVTNPIKHTKGDGFVTYKSDKENVATVDATTGEVTIVGAGTATITATAAETGDYKDASASYDLTVTQHEFSDQWLFDENNHWHKCIVNGCDAKSGSADHEFQWVVDKEATTTEKGSKHEECTVCGYKKVAVEIPVIESGTTGGDQNNGNAGNGTKADTANGSKTGDAMPIGMLAVLMLAAAAGIVFCGRKLYKSR